MQMQSQHENNSAPMPVDSEPTAINSPPIAMDSPTPYDITGDELSELEEDVKSSCSNTNDYRNKFYPQYVDSQNHHVARHEQEEVAGFDSTKNFASL
jgi:hypothetical protein